MRFSSNALPEIANNAWDEWSKEKGAKERRAELEAVAQATGKQLAESVEQVVREVAAGASPDVREALTSYLRQVPAEIRRTLRRPTDPTGTTVPAGLVLRKGDDLLPFLPARVSRFKPGLRPLAGVDLVLDEFLGAGGFGEVWKARNPHFDGFPSVALKFCLDPQTSKRLLTHQAMVEAEVLKRGRHPGIVELQATYLDADPPCLQYEYVEGGDLAGLIQEWHRQPKKPTAIQAAKVIRRLSEIVGHAHRLNPKVVHRDLKPSNILTRRTGNDGAVQFKVADFGIGAVVSDQVIRVMGRGMSRRPDGESCPRFVHFLVRLTGPDTGRRPAPARRRPRFGRDLVPDPDRRFGRRMSQGHRLDGGSFQAGHAISDDRFVRFLLREAEPQPGRCRDLGGEAWGATAERRSGEGLLGHGDTCNRATPCSIPGPRRRGPVRDDGGGAAARPSRLNDSRNDAGRPPGGFHRGDTGFR